MKEKIYSYLKLWTITFTILGFVFAGIGLYKIMVYENPEYSWQGEPKNTYVGGDAYNYIINGTYFAGYSALSGAMFICASICATNKWKIDIDDARAYSEKKERKDSENTDSPTQEIKAVL